MTNLFSIQNLQELAQRTNGSLIEDSNDTVRIVYNCKGVNYTEMYFGSKEKGFRKHY